MKRQAVARTLRELAEKRFPDNGYVNYYMARHFDYEVEKPDLAFKYYKKAVKALPNNPLILKEYLLFLDMAVKDQNAIEKLLKERQAPKDAQVMPLLKLKGPGSSALFCEAAVSAKSFQGMAK